MVPSNGFYRALRERCANRPMKPVSNGALPMLKEARHVRLRGGNARFVIPHRSERSARAVRVYGDTLPLQRRKGYPNGVQNFKSSVAAGGSGHNAPSANLVKSASGRELIKMRKKLNRYLMSATRENNEPRF
jgi:hypothetical protein